MEEMRLRGWASEGFMRRFALDGWEGARNVGRYATMALKAVDLTPSPVAVVALASVVCGGSVMAAMMVTGDLRGIFLIWNLLLAWLPLLFAMLAGRPGNSRPGRGDRNRTPHVWRHGVPLRYRPRCTWVSG